jgi:hypothetical protein
MSDLGPSGDFLTDRGLAALLVAARRRIATLEYELDDVRRQLWQTEDALAEAQVALARG